MTSYRIHRPVTLRDLTPPAFAYYAAVAAEFARRRKLARRYGNTKPLTSPHAIAAMRARGEAAMRAKERMNVEP